MVKFIKKSVKLTAPIVGVLMMCVLQIQAQTLPVASMLCDGITIGAASKITAPTQLKTPAGYPNAGNGCETDIEEVEIYSTGFEASESFPAGSTYNNTTPVHQGEAGKQWVTFYGTTSSQSPITGGQSMQMRWYTTATSNLGYTYTNFNLKKATRVTFKAKNTASGGFGLNMKVSYSTDGGTNWENPQIFTLTTAVSSLEYAVSETGEYENVRLRFEVSLQSSNPTGTVNLYLDDVKVYGIPTLPKVAIPTFSPGGGTYYATQNVSINCATEDVTIFYTTDGSTPTNASQVYSTPVNVASNATVKAFATATGMEDSEIGEATYTIILTPTLFTTPATTLNFSNVYVNETKPLNLNVKGYNLTENLTVTITGAGYSAATTTIAKEDAMSVAGFDVTVNFTPTAIQSYPASLMISSSEIPPVTLNLTGIGVPIPLIGWDFFGQSSPVTFAATTYHSDLTPETSYKNITRGPGAASSTGANSFRTTGFQNTPITISKTAYFQVTIKPDEGKTVSLSSISGNANGTESYAVTPGVSTQFAYSLDGTTFTLIGSPQVKTGNPQTFDFDVSSISDLQNVEGTIYLRYYAQGQTTTGGWGLFSNPAGTNGLAIFGSTGEVSAPTYTIIASAGENGTINPSGEITVPVGGSQIFTFIPDAGYEVDQLFIDDALVYIGAGETEYYEFTDVNKDCSIHVTFRQAGFCFGGGTGGGNGTQERPFEICDAPTLAGLAAYVNSGNGNLTAGVHYVLVADIDLGGYPNWEPIGNYANYDCVFRGNFDGAGFVVKNLTINKNTNHIGLFGFLDSGSKVENLGIESGNVTGLSNTGGLAGYTYYAVINNCYSKVNVTGDGFTGGLVGYNSTLSSITNSYSTGNITGTYNNCGGLVGYNDSYSTITNCYAAGNVNGINFVGGIAGYNKSGCTIRNCVAANDIVTATQNTAGINRVVGNNEGILQNNYAYNEMLLQAAGTDASTNDGLNTESGKGETINTLKNYTFYNTAGNWNGGVWSISTEANPNATWRICEFDVKLPWLQWQGEMDCNLPTYTITATAGENGTIYPEGVITIIEGEDQTFTFTPNNCYEIDEILVNGMPLSEGTDSYTFINVISSQTISVTFKPIVYTQTIVASICEGEEYDFYGDMKTEEGVYTTTIENSTGCNVSVTLILTVNPIPDVDQILDIVILTGETVSEIYFESSLPGTVYHWTNDTPSIGLAVEGVGNIMSFIAINITTAPIVATITVTPESADGCYGEEMTFTITVKPDPTTIVSTTPSNKNVIIEEFTGATCLYCPAGNKVVDQIMDSNPGRVWGINVHQGSYANTTPDLKTDFGDALNNQYGNYSYPAATFNRGVAVNTLRNTWNTETNARLAEPSPVNVAAKGTIDWQTRHLTLLVEVYYTGNAAGETNKLNVALIQNNILGNQTGGATYYPEMMVGDLYKHNHVLRDLITGQWGVDVTPTTTTSFYTHTFEYDIPADVRNVDVVLEDLDILVFVAEDQKTILSGAKAEIEIVNVTTTYTITATAGANGSINPEGTITVNAGENQTFHFTPATCYKIDQVLINGINNPPAVIAGSSTFENVTENHTIHVTFKPIVYTETIAESICEGEEYEFDGEFLTEEGVYTATIVNGVGCDVEVTLTLTVNPIPEVDQISNMEFNAGENTGIITFTGSVAETVYHWTNDTPSIGLAAEGVGNIMSFIAINITSVPVVATITVTPVSAAACIGEEMTFTITVNPAPATTYTITALAGSNGTIDPEGTITVNAGENQTFAFTPATCYEINEVLVDGNPATVTDNSYTFTNVTANHTIHVTFKPIVYTQTIVASICEGEEYDFYGEMLTEEGVYTATIVNGLGCDVEVTLTLTVNPIPDAEQIANLDFNAGENTGIITFTGSVAGTVFHWTNDTPSIGLAAEGTGNIMSFIAINTTSVPVVATITVTPVSAAACIGEEMTFTITVNSALPTYTITATAGTGGKITPSGAVNVVEGNNQTFIFTANNGYAIEQVLIDGVNDPDAVIAGNYTFTNVEDNHTIEIVFEKLDLPYYNILVSFGSGGKISPNGNVKVMAGDNQTFNITPNHGYKINRVLIDGIENTQAITDGFYTFTDVSADHTLMATFTYVSIDQYFINASATTTGGTISPSGKIPVMTGENQTFIITAQAGYQIQELLVDGIGVANTAGATNYEYTFEDITDSHIITVKFEKRNLTIISSVSTPGGTVTPLGASIVTYGGSKAYTFTSQTGYLIDEVLINGINNPTAASSGKYTFNNVTDSHTIIVSFKLRTWTITASAGAGGEINPNGITTIQHGNSLTCFIIPDVGFMIKQVLVNGKNVAASVISGTYTFSNITANQTITATFVPTNSVAATTDENIITIYPNPTTGMINVQCLMINVQSVEIFDVMGRIVAVETHGRASLHETLNVKPEITFDLSNAPSGIYFVRIQTETGVITKKVIKQ